MSRTNEREMFYKMLPKFLKLHPYDFTADEVVYYMKRYQAKKYLSSFSVRAWLHMTPLVRKVGTTHVQRMSGGTQRVNLYSRA